MNNRITKRMCALLLCLAMLGGMLCLTGCGGEVNTYSVEYIAYIDEWLSTSESMGEVSTFNMQNVYGSETMQILEVYVTEGQRVKKGDALLSYDTALTEIELEKKELEVMELELELRQAEQELKTVNNYKPMVITTVVPSPSDVVGEKVTGWKQTGGVGTEKDPYIFTVEDGSIPCSERFFDGVFESGRKTVWVVFHQRTDNMTDGKITEHWGICYKNELTGVTMSFFDSYPFSINRPTEPYEEIEFNSGLTAADIGRMRIAAQERIQDADLKYRIADLEYQQMLLEVENGVITASIDGVIELVAEDIDTAVASFQPIVKVSDNGGYVVQGTLSELELGTVVPGQTVKVTSWSNYMEYEAEITEVSTIPTAQSGWTNGNTNVSYYAFTVHIDGSANLIENDYVSISYNSKGGSAEGFYLERAFVLSENGRSFVFVQNDEGRVEKREIETGEYLWGSYVRIVSGLELDDRIAFPYDKNAKDGAAAREAELDELYSY